MITAERVRKPCPSESARATFLRQERRPLFLCSWDRVLMIHYAMDPEVLQPSVPFPLDLHEGRAYVSLVAFTLSGMRFGIGGPPFATHGFLNVRAYVRHRAETGIYFLAEWLPNPLCVFMGPRLYGLPYKRGRMDYRHLHETGFLSGRVSAKQGDLAYHAPLDPGSDYRPCTEDGLDAFLMERYTAFTRHGDRAREFRVWHPPWKQARVSVRMDDERLIASTGDWFRSAQRVTANYSPGFREVWMGSPREVEA